LPDQAESYLDLATRRWLVEWLTNANPRKKDRHLRLALSGIADGLENMHQDNWLKDMLAEVPSPALARAAKTLSNAIEFDSMGRYDDGFLEAERAQSEFRAAGSEAGALRAAFEMVYALDRAAQGPKCKAAAHLLRVALKRHQYSWLNVQTLSEEATCRTITGDWASALSESEEAVSLAKSVGYKTLYLRVLGNAASIDSVRGDYSKSWSKNWDGLSEYWARRYPPARAFQFYSDLSYVAEDSEQPYTALALAREAALCVALVGNRSGEALAHYRVGTLATAVNENEEAEAEFRKAAEMFADLQRQEASLAHHPKTTYATLTSYRTAGTVMLAAIKIKNGQFDAAEALLQEAQPTISSVENFTVPLSFYQTLGRLYVKQNRYDEAVRAFSSAMTIGEVGVRAMGSDHDRLLWDREVGKAYRDFVKIELLHDQRAEEALDFWEWYKGMALRMSDRKAFASTAADIDFSGLPSGKKLDVPPSIARTRPNLQETTILSFVQMDDGIAAWLFDDRGISSRWVPVQKVEQDRVISRFNQACANPKSDLKILNQDGRELYNWLVGSFAPQLDPKRDLVIEPDGTLATVAIEALIDENGIPIGSRFAIASSPGIAYMARLRQLRVLNRRISGLIVGTPSLNGVIAGQSLPIPDATQEAELIASLIPDSHLLLGKEATARRIEAILPKVELFHFAGHAIFGPGMVGLFLAPDSSETGDLNQVSLMNAATFRGPAARHLQLAVLSACTTVEVGLDRNSDPDSLVRTFLLAGVPHVVASRWDVDSRITSRFMKDFYAALFAGKSVSRSLQSARMGLRGQMDSSHPYYWAAFTAFGRS
jgi:CHAT domain-containing protein/tetratricopeptide (TPR) repeat protein